jgi:arsenate reductase
MITVYGIRNCDKCRAALKWFEAKEIHFRFHDLRADGLSAEELEWWQKIAGDDALMNKRSQTWRKIPSSETDGLDGPGNQRLMLKYPTLIKRPIVSNSSTIVVGYDESGWTNTFVDQGKNQ